MWKRKRVDGGSFFSKERECLDDIIRIDETSGVYSSLSWVVYFRIYVYFRLINSPWTELNLEISNKERVDYRESVIDNNTEKRKKLIV